MNKKSKKTLGLIIVVVIVLAAVGYGVFAYMSKSWPFGASAADSSKATIEISKLEAKNDVLNVKVKVSGTEEKGHCVLMLASKKAGIKIDDAEAKKTSKQNVPFEDCVGWSVGVKQLPAGKYTVEAQFVGANTTVSAKDEVTLK